MKMTWNLIDSQVDLYGVLSFVPDIDYWLDANNTYRVVFIQVNSLGQYVQFNDIVENVLLENINNVRLDASIQPNMKNGVYFKSWTATVNGVPPSGGGGGGGYVKNVVVRDMKLNEVDLSVHVYQTNGGHSNDTPSFLQFSDLSFIDWSGTTTANTPSCNSTGEA
ncbi:hypothetical protein EW145_g4159 [Phellinidium pouzarii]|uniref:galacturonan 1,4-alpha-galacturonidase n=1 Tax=Phellinidium pouzarii TaxID=167371 RepID=A0A4S4L4Q5_9AGAM|nr:hypothetical protein EW145_g4159 [Phellinidium pouzarii]